MLHMHKFLRARASWKVIGRAPFGSDVEHRDHGPPARFTLFGASVFYLEIAIGTMSLEAFAEIKPELRGKDMALAAQIQNGSTKCRASSPFPLDSTARLILPLP